MATLILKSTNALDASVDLLDFTLYKKRVINDGGFIADEQAVKNAFLFIATNEISEKEVFSATSANWGVKISSGNPVKLYSLFGSRGDINVAVLSDAAINYNSTSFSKPVIELKSSSLNKLLSENFGTINSAGIFVLASVPILASGASYGPGIGFIMGEIANYDVASTAADSLARRYLTLQYSRPSVDLLPTSWLVNMRAHGNAGTVSTATKNVSGWAGYSAYTDANSADLYENGILVGRDDTVLPTVNNSNLRFSIGLGRDTFGSGNGMMYPLYAYIAETWCMLNTTSEKMRILSSRAFV